MTGRAGGTQIEGARRVALNIGGSTATTVRFVVGAPDDGAGSRSTT